MHKKKQIEATESDQAWPQELGANCEVGKKLRAFYASIQDEVIPEKLLCLLEQLEMAEQDVKQKENDSGGVG